MPFILDYGGDDPFHPSREELGRRASSLGSRASLRRASLRLPPLGAYGRATQHFAFVLFNVSRRWLEEVRFSSVELADTLFALIQVRTHPLLARCGFWTQIFCLLCPNPVKMRQRRASANALADADAK